MSFIIGKNFTLYLRLVTWFCLFPPTDLELIYKDLKIQETRFLWVKYQILSYLSLQETRFLTTPIDLIFTL